MMKRTIAAVVLPLAIVAAAERGPLAGGRDDDASVVIEWNRLLQDTIPATASLRSPRYYAMLHAAMFDAVNSIENRYQPYRVRVRSSHGASSEAAAAQAARDILTALIPTSQSAYDAALAATLAKIPKGQAGQGIRVGQKAAAEILRWRQADGWDAPPPPYVLPTFPGLWQPVPGAAAFTQYPGVTPFATLSSTQFLPARPPTLTSAEYAADFAEVKRMGSRTSTDRTAEQTELARLFAGEITRTTLWALWNNVAGDTARSRGLDLLDAARLFALVNISIHDGLQTSHTSKFVYGLWRPITAIRRAGEDMNDATEPDPDWMHLLLATPAYPSHAGNMACVGASAATALARVHGTDEIAFTAVWAGNAANPTDVSRNYAGFWAMALDQAKSRVYGGIHFNFENVASQEACPKVVDFVVSNYMQPKD
jgi:hypothetical protein